MKNMLFILLCTVALVVTSTIANAITLPDSCVAVSDTLTLQFRPDRGLGMSTVEGDPSLHLTVLYLGGQQWLLVNDVVYGVILDNPAVGVVRYFAVRECCRRSVLRYAKWKFPQRTLTFHDAVPTSAKSND